MDPALKEALEKELEPHKSAPYLASQPAPYVKVVNNFLSSDIKNKESEINIAHRIDRTVTYIKDLLESEESGQIAVVGHSFML